MKMVSGHKRLSQLLKSGIIALVVYFSQVYPYVHFHHVHTEAEAPIEASRHPVDAVAHHSHHGHDHEESSHGPGNDHHHHSEFNQHVDWHLVRTYSNNRLSHSDIAYHPIRLIVTADVPLPTPCPRIDRTFLPESVPIDGIVTRGPPDIG